MQSLEGWPAYALLFLAAAIEYVFPPFPGDAAVLLGVFLAVWRGWNCAAVFVSTLLGAVFGAAATWQIGRWLGGLEEKDFPAGSLIARVRPSREGFHRFTALVAKYGPAVIAVNRFFPGLRAFFILAAGMARIPFGKTIFYASVSAFAWNSVLFLAGRALGDNWDVLHAFFRTYTFVAVGAVCVIIAVFVVVVLVRRTNTRDGN
ncbi:MAG: DedA family protein [Verrucomicrobia bacterium]|nr:DedA family protein [Verrucomicrobiota bacterium]